MISHNPKFIFIHVRKTGGNSIQHALSDYSPDKIRFVDSPITGPNQNFSLIGKNKHGNLAYWERNCIGDPKEYYKFLCVRNPYDRYISVQIFKRRLPKKLNTHFRMGPIEIYFEGREDDIDYFVDFDNMEIEFKKVCDDLGIKNITLPHLNKSKHETFDKYFTDDKVIRAFREKYKYEIDLYNKHRIGDYEIDERFGV